ncbi:MAG: thymidine phosphorylase [Spirochaetota bacterium]|jgi:pyrimidine-nucleoside phosphorylase|nr:thymidine phosphorylase [Spirochaetota bacterium]
MRVYDCIKKKRDGGKLSAAEIEHIVTGAANESIPDYQLAAFLMAVYIRGMDDEETGDYTRAMMHSGDVFDLSAIDPKTVDKHSTGGVGDKISLILAPSVAAGGAIVPMMSGRGLGHTGGTLDKLEAIPGYRVGLSSEEFMEALKKIGVAIIGQTGRLAPADKKLYALRDVTATISSIPLITGSIMGKKLAAGPASIVMDVKWGSGTFMRTVADARALAASLTAAAKHMGRSVTCYITDMNQPLGFMIGNMLEILEVIDCLHGRGPADIMELTRAQAGSMLVFAGKAKTYDEGCAIFDRVIADGSAFNKFCDMVAFQGGDAGYVRDPAKFRRAEKRIAVPAAADGYINTMDGTSIGISAIYLGGGREKSEDIIDHAVGIEIVKKCGDAVKKGETIAWMHANPASRLDEAMAKYQSAIDIKSKPPEKLPLIVEWMSST